MLRLGLVAIIMALFLVSNTPTGQAENKPQVEKPQLSQSEVQKWIAKLADPDYQNRQQAMEKLRSFGVQVIPFLEEAVAKETDPSIQRSLKELLSRFQAAPTLAPTRICLQLKHVSLSDTVQALGRATGYRFELAPSAESSEGQVVYSWDWQNVTFWEALQDLCNKAGVSFVEGWYSWDGKTIRLEPGESHPSYTSLHGPFRVTITGFHYNRSISFFTGPMRWNNAGTIQRNESLSINLRVTVEPRYALTGTREVVLEEAVDDTGMSRVLARPDGSHNFSGYFYGGGRIYNQHISATLLPGNLGGKLKLLRGQISAFVIAGERPVITLENLVPGKPQRVEKNGMTLQVDSLRDDGQQVQLRLHISRAGEPNRRDPNWIHTVPQRIKVYDAKGNELRGGGAISWTSNADTAEGTLVYHRENGNAAPGIGIGRILGGKPPSEQFKLVYFEWEIVQTQIPFQFRDVPLP